MEVNEGIQLADQAGHGANGTVALSSDLNPAVDLAVYDNLLGNCVGGIPPTPPPVSTTATSCSSCSLSNVTLSCCDTATMRS